MRVLGWRGAALGMGVALLALGRAAGGAIVFPTTQSIREMAVQPEEERTFGVRAESPEARQRGAASTLSIAEDELSLMDETEFVMAGGGEAAPVVEPIGTTEEPPPTIPLSAVDSVYLNVSTASPMLAVPEPSGISIIGVAMAMLLRRRRRLRL